MTNQQPVTIEFAIAYARLNQSQRDAVRDNLGRPLVVVGELEWACLRALADEVERLKAEPEKPCVHDITIQWANQIGEDAIK